MKGYAQSSIGVRANWTCAECKAAATTNQIATVAHTEEQMVGVILDLPAGWKARGQETFCPAHARRAA